MGLQDRIKDLEESEGIDEQILNLVRDIHEELPNGKVDQIQRELKGVKDDVGNLDSKVDNLCVSVQNLTEDVEELNDRVLDPEGGVVAKTNTNEAWISRFNKIMMVLIPIVLGLLARSLGWI